MSDRDVLFSNESLVIGMLQAVSGSMLVAALAQEKRVIELAGRWPFLLFATLAALALGTAVVAAFLKHQYKMWDVKSNASAGRRAYEETIRRNERARWYLSWMRRSIVAAVLLIVLGLFVVIVGLWASALCTPSTAASKTAAVLLVADFQALGRAT